MQIRDNRRKRMLSHGLIAAPGFRSYNRATLNKNAFEFRGTHGLVEVRRRSYRDHCGRLDGQGSHFEPVVAFATYNHRFAKEQSCGRRYRRR